MAGEAVTGTVTIARSMARLYACPLAADGSWWIVVEAVGQRVEARPTIGEFTAAERRIW